LVDGTDKVIIASKAQSSSEIYKTHKDHVVANTEYSDNIETEVKKY